MEAICLDAARKRLQQETSCRIERIKDAIEIGDFIIVRAARDVEEPFYVAQVNTLIHLRLAKFTFCALKQKLQLKAMYFDRQQSGY
jgi:hypothetical protein